MLGEYLAQLNKIHVKYIQPSKMKAISNNYRASFPKLCIVNPFNQ